ncbi:MAG: hypothetical protein K2I25_06880, partial [Muribaculaceae bacterium]|nr:hypothetical protein [Muribaculaceae bacterium]
MATKFSSKIGLIAATVGSAVGLGNIWRFPAEAQGNGGAAFLLVYVACVLLPVSYTQLRAHQTPELDETHVLLE